MTHPHDQSPAPLTAEVVAEMQRDMAAGTPGPWEVAEAGTYPDDEGAKVLGPASANSRGNRVRYYVAQFCTRDARRIARLPDLEAGYLALATQLAEREKELARVTAERDAALEREGDMRQALQSAMDDTPGWYDLARDARNASLSARTQRLIARAALTTDKGAAS